MPPSWRLRLHQACTEKVRYSRKLGPPGRIGDLLFANSPDEPVKTAKAALASYESAYHSVGAGIRPGARRVIRVIRAIEAVVVVTADEMTTPNAKVLVVHKYLIHNYVLFHLLVSDLRYS